MDNIELKENERIDDLQYKGLKIIQDITGFCFGIDSVILSDFAKEIKNGSTVVDLGTGTGILGILLCGKTNASKIIGVEIQTNVADMAKRSIKLNNLENKFDIINSDIKDIIKNNIIQKNTIDIIITNPPYKEIGKGIINNNKKKLISRHEISAKLSDFIEISKELLKNNGILYMVHKPERLVDIIFEMRKNKIEPKEIKFVYPSRGKEANLVLIKGIKGANKFLKIKEPLYIYRENGIYTEDILKIYNI